MVSPERRRKRRRSARARIGFRASYEGGMGYFRRMPRLPNVAVLFSVVMMVAVSVRKMVMSSARAKSAELNASIRAARTPLAVLLEEQHEIHYQAAALSDPSNKCRSHTNGGHKQPDTLGVFTCVADARFLLRALIVMQGFAPMLVVDMGSPPASDAGGITSGRGWDLRERKQAQVNRRIKFREEPLPESAALVLIEAHKVLSADDWIDVTLSVLQLLTPDGSIVLMEQRQNAIPHRDVEDQYGAWTGSAELREALTDLACDEAGLVVALGAFDEGIAVVRRAGEDLSRLERGCILAEDVNDQVVDGDEPEDREEGFTAAAASTNTTSAATGTTSSATGTASSATGTASSAAGTASAATGTASAANDTASAANGTATAATGMTSDATGIALSVVGTASAASGTASAAIGTASAASGTASAATGTEAAVVGTEATAMGTVAPPPTEATAAGTVAPPATRPLLRFEALFSFAMGTTWTPETVQTKFGGKDAIRKYAHRAGSRLFCVKNLARDSEGTGMKKQSTTKPSGEREKGSGKLRSSKRNGASETDTTPEQIARACLEKHMKKHPKDVRGAFVLELVLQAGGGADGVNVDRQVARLREEACTERGEAGLSLWKALHTRSASAGATGLLLP